jgi:hypothetical protein
MKEIVKKHEPERDELILAIRFPILRYSEAPVVAAVASEASSTHIEEGLEGADEYLKLVQADVAHAEKH